MQGSYTTHGTCFTFRSLQVKNVEYEGNTTNGAIIFTPTVETTTPHTGNEHFALQYSQLTVQGSAATTKAHQRHVHHVPQHSKPTWVTCTLWQHTYWRTPSKKDCTKTYQDLWVLSRYRNCSHTALFLKKTMTAPTRNFSTSRRL